MSDDRGSRQKWGYRGDMEHTSKKLDNRARRNPVRNLEKRKAESRVPGKSSDCCSLRSFILGWNCCILGRFSSLGNCQGVGERHLLTSLVLIARVSPPFTIYTELTRAEDRLVCQRNQNSNQKLIFVFYVHGAENWSACIILSH